MAAMIDVLVPALCEAREAEAAVAGRFRAHAAVLPAGEDRSPVTRRIAAADEHVRGIDKRLSALRREEPRSVLGTVWGLARQAVRLPFDLAVGIPAAALRGRASRQQMLKNAENDYAVAAYAVAAGRAGERIAQQVGDAASATLLHAIQDDDEALLTDLGYLLDQHADRLVAATAEGVSGETSRSEAAVGGPRWSTPRAP